MTEYPYAEREDTPPRCSKCGCFMKATSWLNEGSGEEESVECTNKKCKSNRTKEELLELENRK